MGKNKKVLVVNYYYPPAGGAGVRRTLKFIKFLPKNGWDPIVLTVENGNHPQKDASLLQATESDVIVYRTLTFETIFNKGVRSSDETVGSLYEDNALGVNSIGHLLKRAYKFVGQFLRIPDSRILWLPVAIFVGFKISLTNKFDAIYATGPTFTSLIIGAVLKIICRKPLIVDFRDAWMGDPMFQLSNRYLTGINAALEKFVVNNADRVISTNPFVTRDFQQRYSKYDNSKFDTIFNGFDIDDYEFVKSHKPKKNNQFTIVHTGILYHERTPKSFLEALRDAIRREPDIRGKIKVIFVGRCEKFMDGKRVEDYLKDFSLRDIVILTGQISRKESLEYQRLAQLLLVIIGLVPREKELTYGIPGKIFDYIVSEKPILTLANGGATREFVTENQIGSIYYHKDIKGISNYLIKSYQEFQSGLIEKGKNIRSHEKFDVSLLTKKLSSHLNNVIKKQG